MSIVSIDIILSLPIDNKLPCDITGDTRRMVAMDYIMDISTVYS